MPFACFFSALSCCGFQPCPPGSSLGLLSCLLLLCFCLLHHTNITTRVACLQELQLPNSLGERMISAGAWHQTQHNHTKHDCAGNQKQVATAALLLLSSDDCFMPGMHRTRSVLLGVMTRAPRPGSSPRAASSPYGLEVRQSEWCLVCTCSGRCPSRQAHGQNVDGICCSCCCSCYCHHSVCYCMLQCRKMSCVLLYTLHTAAVACMIIL